MTIQDRVLDDWKKALKAKDQKKDALSMILTEFKNRAIKENISREGQRTVPDEMALEVLQKMAKQRRESIAVYKQANRLELAKKEELELSAVESYLPKALSEDELHALVAKVINDTQAQSMKDMGKVMALCIKDAKGRADGNRIKNMVKSQLGK